VNPAVNHVRLSDYVDQAQVTNWPARISLVVVVLLLIVLVLWGMRRGWLNRQRRQSWIPMPMDAPGPDDVFSASVPGLFLGSATAGDWMDRIAVHDLGVRSRANASWGPAGVWFERVGARSVFVPATDLVGFRVDRGVAGTVKAKDSVVVVTWRLGDAVVDTGFRADETTAHHAMLDGLAEVGWPGGGVPHGSPGERKAGDR
jgi:hypothetical protein